MRHTVLTQKNIMYSYSKYRIYDLAGSAFCTVQDAAGNYAHAYLSMIVYWLEVVSILWRWCANPRPVHGIATMVAILEELLDCIDCSCIRKDPYSWNTCTTSSPRARNNHFIIKFVSSNFSSRNILWLSTTHKIFQTINYFQTIVFHNYSRWIVTKH